ncbi:ABC transporter permease [Micromonospora parathelypteridis]|uniref:Putative ABC transport system permease protein n=1 Tax=Micromonospora parathelypteridis TaxID=1839617 RepID=A0A840VS40_9ACTN|nr:FtsX-like permease family protein [Micromonospora parathelypteridis]MBB5480053.1 putative ABC transport system permease protein [Micromonospora parathelypteridis]GGO25274.1 ABC transporter permease [Micromonospora parathelypteridis]
MTGLAARLLRHRVGPAAATLLALLAGVMILVAMGTLVESGLRFRPEPRLWATADLVVAHRTVSHTIKEFDGGTTTSTVRLPEGGTVDAALVDRIRQVPGVADVTGDDRVLVGSSGVVGHGWGTYGFTGRPISAGAAPQADDEVLADVRLGSVPGDRMDLVVGGISRSYRVSGTAETGSAAVFFTDAQAARLSAHPGRVDAIGVRVVPGADRGAVGDAVRGIASAAGATTYAGTDRAKVEQSENLSAQTLLVEAGSAFGGYVLLLIVFVVAGTIGLSVRHRRRDLALLRAVAATPGQLRRMLIAEAALLALAASAVGAPAGLLAAHWVHGQLVGRGFVPASFPMTGGLFAVPVAVGTAVLVAMLAALIAGRRVTGIKPVEALGEIAVEPRRSGRVRLVAGVLTLAAAGTSGAFTLGGTGPTAALAGAVGMLYLFVIAVALLAPRINAHAARLLTPVLPRIWQASGYLAAANLRANAQGMATVLTALVLSVGFGGSVWFLQTNLERQTIAQSAAGTLAERVLVASGGLPTDTAREVRELAGVRAATGVRRTQVVVRSFDGIEPVGAQAVDPAGITSTIDLGVREGDLADLRAGAVALSATQASASGWDVGDQAELWLGDGTPVKLEVVAIYGRGLGFGDVTLAAETVAAHTAGATDDEVLISASPDADAALAAWSAGHPGSQVLDAATRTRLVGTDLALGAWLNRLLIGVMVGYAALAAATTMVLAALARRRELALLQLVGVTRRQIRGMVHAEQAGLLGTALLIGATIAALTLGAIVNALTGSPIPYVPPLGWVAVLGGTTLLALATTVWPVRRLLSAPPIDNIGVKE